LNQCDRRESVLLVRRAACLPAYDLGMKQIGLTLMLFVVVLSPLAAVCQGLPDSPAPQRSASQTSSSSSLDGVPQSAPLSNQQAAAAPAAKTAAPDAAAPDAAPPDAPWRRIQQLSRGDWIRVNSTLGPPLGCRFAGATDDALFCDPANAPEGTGYRFDRATVITVEVQRPERNWHPAWMASMIAGGLVVGLVASQTNDAGESARLGAIGALVVGAIGAPLAFLPSGDRSMVAVVYRPHAFRFHGRGPMGLRPRRR
jgi:hypothetical protein